MEFDKLYDMFQQAGEDWMKSELVIASTSSREHARTGRWKTMSQKEPLLSWKKYICIRMHDYVHRSCNVSPSITV